ncbi:quinolinate synthase NadA [Pyrolobus fumarii]|nr:quinolinate synthase NadA [Pyrolobus fumarii]
MSGFIEELREKIARLKEKRRAVILAHNYQLPEVQDVADLVGDSLELARAAMETDADVIVFAGVRFMAEMAAALNPDRVVLHPVPEAGCPLADSLAREDVARAREEHPGAPFLVYVNSPLWAKAEADYVVTSASAAKLASILAREGVEKIVFGPDRNLAEYVEEVTGVKTVPVPTRGHCPVHEFLISPYYVRKAREKWGDRAAILVHPEAPRESRRMADFVGSTSQMIRAVAKFRDRSVVLLGTEEGLVYRARRLNPGVRVEPLNPIAVCIDMKKITLQAIADALEKMEPKVRVDPNVARRAREVIEESVRIVTRS